MPDVLEARIEREREFHNSLERVPLSLRALRMFSEVFYEKGEKGILWAQVWPTCDLRGKTALDYGCGSGGFSFMLARQGARARGVDVSDYQVSCGQAEARRTGLDVELTVGDAHHTGYPDGTFDYVFGNGILHHLDLPRAYREITRILKPDGIAYFTEPMIHHPLLWFLRWATPNLRSKDERPMTMKDIESAASCGLHPICRFHYLTAVAAAPFRIFGLSVANTVLHCLDHIDQLLFRTFPSLREYAWYTVIEFSKEAPRAT